MPQIERLIRTLRETSCFRLLPPAGVPRLPKGLLLPADLREFYEVAGGAELREDAAGFDLMRIVGPQEFRRIDLAIMDEELQGPFRNWFAVADVSDGNYLAIDCHPDHLGKCYDCFHETFTEPGYVNVIADSFTDLLKRLMNSTEGSYWIAPDFVPLGEAFETYGIRPSE